MSTSLERPANPLSHRRPLSPHLGIYRWRATMAMSVVHRLTGIALYGGLVGVALWLAAAAAFPGLFDGLTAILRSWFGTLLLLAFLFALYAHLFGGLRHLIWDMGVGMGSPSRDWLAWATVAAALVATVATVLLVRP